MKPNQNLHFLDPTRWLFGLTPAWFLLEVLGRTILIYFMLQLVLRLIGRRVASQMTAAELGVIVTIAAAIGVPMQAPDRGMLPTALILIMALIFQRVQGAWQFRSEKAEKITTGDVVTVIEDGRILFDSLWKLVLSRERLFSVLRAKGIVHLGEVQRGYVEVTGDFSLYKFRQPVAGLSIMPSNDERLKHGFQMSADHFACAHCGALEERQEKPGGECVHCKRAEWIHPVVTINRERLLSSSSASPPKNTPNVDFRGVLQ